MATASDVARYFLTKCDEDSGDTISNLKIQKLLYYAQGFHLALFGRALFDEPIEAWRHGPVVRQVYAEYADYGSGSIPYPENFDLDRLSEEERDLSDEVYEVYGQYSAWRLREMTHSEPPWRDAWDSENSSKIIDHASLAVYFSTLVEQEA